MFPSAKTKSWVRPPNKKLTEIEILGFVLTFTYSAPSVQEIFSKCVEWMNNTNNSFIQMLSQ